MPVVNGWPALLLWDIDGTLVRGGRAAIAAFDRALRHVYALPDGAIARIATAGKTDGQIVVETLAEHGFAAATVIERLAAFRDHYAVELAAVEAEVSTDLTVLPGVPAALTRLAEHGLWQSLLTGNTEPAARVKLRCAGLDHHFDFAIGAYGSDHLDRTCLVPIALARLRAVHDRELAPERVVVIGDTPRDIACARAAGARVIAVATGHSSVAELQAHQPDLVLPDLTDTAALLAALGA